MQGSRKSGSAAALAALTALAASALALSCAGTPRKSALMEKHSEKIQMSGQELRVRMQSAISELSGLIEEGADEILSQDPPPGARREALLWKIDGIPLLQEAMFQRDPLGSLLNAWVLSYQMETYFEEGPGGKALGDFSGIATATSRRLEAELGGIASQVASSPEAFESSSARMRKWAAENPIQRTLAGRRSTTSHLAALLTVEEQGAFASVGSLSEDLEDLSARLDVYNNFLPKQARWQAELLAADLVSRSAVESRLEKMDALADAGTKAASSLESVPDLMERERQAVLEGVRSERVAIFASLHGELAQTLDRVTQERKAVFQSLVEERVALTGAVDQERSTTLKELDALSGKVLEDAAGKARGLMDRFLLRLTILMGGFLALAFAGALVLTRSLRRPLPQ